MPKYTNNDSTGVISEAFAGFYDGTISNPGAYFASDTDNGWYRSAPKTLTFATNSTDILSCSDTGITFDAPENFTYVGVGSAAAPTYTFSAYPTYGFYLDTTGTPGVALSCNSAQQYKVSSAGIDVAQYLNCSNTTDATTGAGNNGSLQSAGGLSVAKSCRSGGKFVAGAGAVGAPALSFTGATTSGLYGSGSNVLFSYNGVQIYYDGVSASAANYPVRYADGSAAAPSITFSGDTDTGLYRPGDDQIGISCGGSDKVLISSTLVKYNTGRIYFESVNSSASSSENQARNQIIFTYASGNVTCTLPNPVIAGQIYSIINNINPAYTLTLNLSSGTFRYNGASSASYVLGDYSAIMLWGVSSSIWCITKAT